MNIENKVKVTICGKEYSLRTDESPEYIKNLAVRTEKEINDLVKLKPGFGIQNAAVFVALTSLDEAAKSNAAVENIRSQIKTYMNEAAKARSSKEKLSAKVRELEEKIKVLENENKELKKRPPLYDCEQLVLENTITPAVTILAEENDPVNSKAAEISADTGEKAVRNGEETPRDKQSLTEASSAVSGDGASCGEEKEQQEEKGEGVLSDNGTEENAEAQSDGGDTRPDNMNAASEHEDDRENKINRSKNRKKKR